MDEAETDLLAHLSFLTPHRGELHSTDHIERFNGKIKWRAEVVGMFSNEDAIVRVVSDLARAERGAGCPTSPLHDAGNHRAPCSMNSSWAYLLWAG